MSTVKISELPEIVHLDSNTSNTIIVGVDIPTGVTGKISASVFGHSLYSNNALNVGNNDITFTGVIGQFVGNNESYLQVNLQNRTSNGSSDYVATADIGTDTVNYIDMGIAGSTDNDSQYTSIKAMDGYLYVQGNTATTTGGNLIIGTTTTHRDVTIVQGGANTEHAVARFSYSSGFKLLQKPITFADGTTQNTSFDAAATSANAAFLKANTPSHVSNSASIYANGAFTQANSAFLKANTPSDVANSSSLYANAAFTQANSAFTKANNALANTSGTFAGALTITNNLTTNGIVKIANTGFSATEAALCISASNNSLTQLPASDGYMIHVSGKHAVPTRIIADSFGANGQISYPVYVGRNARGNVSNPSAVQTNDVLARFSGSGFGTTSYLVGGTARMDIVASENHTDAARGTVIKFYNVTTGSNTITNIATFNANDVIFTGEVVAQKGFVVSPNIQGTLTTFEIDFARDSIVKFNVTDNASLTLSNYVVGKIVEVIITNSAGQNKTITHGCLANNSTNKSTTFTIAFGGAAYLKYFSFDGDQANTFVAITYA